MPEMIYKVLDDCEIKKVGERTYEFTASTSTQDRDGEVIEVEGWDLKNFKKNPVIMYAHDYRSLPIGKATRVWVSDGKLKNVVEFPPEGTYEFADIVERLVDTGYLKTESVGFIPRKWEDGDGEKAPRRTYIKQELLEISLVPVPSNPDALRNAVEEGVITTKELETLSTPEKDNDNKPEETVDPLEEKSVSQAEVKDEISYLRGIIEDVGLNEEATEDAWELVREIMGLTGDHIPDDIKETIGVKPDEIEEPELDEAQIMEIVQGAIAAVIEKAQGKI